MPILLIAILLLGGGTSLAAKSALPGDALYTVKTHMNENIGASFAFSDEAKAHWDAVLMSRRLEEAQKLSAKSKLDASAEAKILANFDAHSKDFNNLVAKMDAKSDFTASWNASSDLEDRMRANEGIWTAIEASSGHPASASILARIRTAISESQSVRASSETKMNAEAATQNSAETQMRLADREIMTLKTFISGSTNADAKVAANAKLDLAMSAYNTAKASLDAKNYMDAKIKFNEAMKIAHQANVFLQIGTKLGISIFTPGSGMENDNSADVNANSNTNTSGNVNTNSGGSINVDGSAGASGGAGSGSVDGGININLGR